jgi:hypothetical protein
LGTPLDFTDFKLFLEGFVELIPLRYRQDAGKVRDYAFSAAISAIASLGVLHPKLLYDYPTLSATEG